MHPDRVKQGPAERARQRAHQAVQDEALDGDHVAPLDVEPHGGGEEHEEGEHDGREDHAPDHALPPPVGAEDGVGPRVGDVLQEYRDDAECDPHKAEAEVLARDL